MALFGDSVPREFYEDMRLQRDRLQNELSMALAEQASLMKDVMAVKRHELGLPPTGFEPKDPTAVLGKRTLAAIEEVAAGFADVRAQQMNWAVVQMQAGLAANRDTEELDVELAERIRQGEEG